MRVLIVSNIYPPFFRGGYEIRCAQVAEALQCAGNEVRVLTSVYGIPPGPAGGIRPRTDVVNGVPVDRWLHEYAYEYRPRRRPWTFFQARHELADVRRFTRVVRTFRPDIVNWWSMNGLAKAVLPLPEWWGIPDVHWIEHPWMIDEYGARGEVAATFWASVWDGQWGPSMGRPILRWLGRHWERRIAAEGLATRAFPNSPRHVCFVSEYLRTLHRAAGMEFASSEVIYGGVPVERFYAPVRVPPEGAPLRVLYAGQISPDRGLHTAVEALGMLEAPLRARLHLDVAGANPSPYFEQVKARVAALDLTRHVTFLGKVAHDAMPGLYREHDVLVFLSAREEGLPLTMVEAMLAGCAVLTTGSGGAMEVATAADLPIVPKGDPAALSRMLSDLVKQPAAVIDIATRGQRVAHDEFSLDRMMKRLTDTLHELRRERPAPVVPSI